MELEKKLKHGWQKNKLTYDAYKKQETVKTVENLGKTTHGSSAEKEEGKNTQLELEW